MIKNLFLALVGAATICSADTNITGAGASFPAPVYAQWTSIYSKVTPNTTVTYQSVGSGSGKKQIKAGTVDFAGSDSPIMLDDQKKDGLEMYPMLTGGVVVIANIPGVKDGQLKLSQTVLADIYLGKITNWNDKAIAACNAGLKLPNLGITVVRRSDASGTSEIFTNYLCKVSPQWKKEVGSNTNPNWPVGQGGQKNPGVCNLVKGISGAIGYTEYTFAVTTGIPCAQLENASGKYLKPSVPTFAASAGSADWANAKGWVMELTNVKGDNAWPITAVTYIVLRKDTPAAMRAELKKYFMWCYTTGAKVAEKLHYIPLPKNVVDQIEPKL